MAVALRVVMNLAEGLVSMPVWKESKASVCKYFNFELDATCWSCCLFAGSRWPQMSPDGPRRPQTAPQMGSDSPKWPPRSLRGAPDTRSGCGLMNIDILYRYAYSIGCKIRIELLLPIYMTTNEYINYVLPSNSKQLLEPIPGLITTLCGQIKRRGSSREATTANHSC